MSATIKDAQLMLDILCSKVKLGRESFPPIEMPIPIPIPTDACLWSGEYACLLLWPLTEQTSENIQESVDQAQDYFDEILVLKESASTNYDGYLVLALDSRPTGKMDEMVRELELSTTVCRKNTIWPAGEKVVPGKGWCRLADIAVLGLPDISMSSEERLTWPEVDDDVRRLWQEISSNSYLNSVPRMEKYNER